MVNCAWKRRLPRAADFNLELSVGNGFIGPCVFSFPRRGVVNVRMELRPKIRGGRSVLWQIFHKNPVADFTVHQIDQSIDTGDILCQELHPVCFRPGVSARQ